jgi:hypothetical protein
VPATPAAASPPPAPPPPAAPAPTPTAPAADAPQAPRLGLKLSRKPTTPPENPGGGTGS